MTDPSPLARLEAENPDRLEVVRLIARQFKEMHTRAVAAERGLAAALHERDALLSQLLALTRWRPDSAEYLLVDVTTSEGPSRRTERILADEMDFVKWSDLAALLPHDPLAADAQ